MSKDDLATGDNDDKSESQYHLDESESNLEAEVTSELERAVNKELHALQDIFLVVVSTKSIQRNLNKGQLMSLCVLYIKGEASVYEEEVKEQLSRDSQSG